jgi:hypothetical protein
MFSEQATTTIVIALIGFATVAIQSYTALKMAALKKQADAIHTEVNSKASIATDKLEVLTAEILTLSKKNATMEEQARPTAPDGSVKP